MVDDVEFPMEGQTFDTNFSDKPLSERRTYHSAGQYGNPQTVSHGIYQCGGAGGFPDRGNGKAGFFRYPVEGFAGSASVFPQKKFLTAECFNGNFRF